MHYAAVVKRLEELEAFLRTKCGGTVVLYSNHMGASADVTVNAHDPTLRDSTGDTWSRYKTFQGKAEDIETLLTKAGLYIQNEIPSAEKRRLETTLRALGQTLELLEGSDELEEVQALLRKAQEKISGNLLTHKTTL